MRHFTSNGPHQIGTSGSMATSLVQTKTKIGPTEGAKQDRLTPCVEVQNRKPNEPRKWTRPNLVTALCEVRRRNMFKTENKIGPTEGAMQTRLAPSVGVLFAWCRAEYLGTFRRGPKSMTCKTSNVSLQIGPP